MKQFFTPFLSVFLLVSGAVLAEQLPSLTPLASSSIIAETILDAPNKPAEVRFMAPKKEAAPATVVTMPAPVAVSAPQNTLLNAPVADDYAPEAQPAVRVAEVVVTEAPIRVPSRFALAERLKTAGDLHNAALTYQWLAQGGSSTDQQFALLAAGRLYAKLGMNSAAAATFGHYLSSFPNTYAVPEALYYVATLGDKDDQGRALQQLKVMHENSAWTREAAYTYIWNYAQTQPLTSMFTDERAKLLKERQQTLPNVKSAVRWVTALAVIPGLGHVYVGDYVNALMYFALVGLLIWAVCFALFWGQLPYALIWGVALVAIYGHSFMNVRALAETQVEAERAATFASWDDLTPKTPDQLRAL